MVGNNNSLWPRMKTVAPQCKLHRCICHSLVYPAHMLTFSVKDRIYAGRDTNLVHKQQSVALLIMLLNAVSECVNVLFNDGKKAVRP